MTSRSALAGRLHISLAVAALLAGCGETTKPAPPPDRPREEVAPIDELAEGELPEGRVFAFGLPVPDGMRLEPRSNLVVTAIGPVPFEEVANFVRDRVEAGQTTTGPSKTVFDRVKIKTPRGPEELRQPLPEKEGAEEVMRIEVSTTKRGHTRLEVSRATRAKAPVGLSEDQRWEKLGIRKNGQPVDPRKFE